MCAKRVERRISKMGACQGGGGGVKYILALRGGKRKRACSEGRKPRGRPRRREPWEPDTGQETITIASEASAGRAYLLFSPPAPDLQFLFKFNLCQRSRGRETGPALLQRRVWSWLRMNAGGVPNTCKSSDSLRRRAADGWVTRG